MHLMLFPIVGELMPILQPNSGEKRSS